LQADQLLRPSVQPKSGSACMNAETRGFCTGSFSSPGTNRLLQA
jgi:hypothetical protein